MRPSSPPFSYAMETERDGNPGIVLVYTPDEVVDAAVAQPGSPVTRGQTPAVSAARLREYIFRTILSTPLSEAANCVVEKASRTGTTYFLTVFHRMSQDAYHSVVQLLAGTFITNNTATADWSCRVCRAPAPALVTLLRVDGGGAGSHPVSFGEGIFRY